MEMNPKAIEYLLRFRNCKIKDIKTPTLADQGMNYILMVMGDGNPVTASALAEEMCVSMARITTLIQKMEEKGLVVRKTSEEDKRVSFITLTDLGMQASKDLLHRSVHIISELIDRVGAERIEDFLDMLGVLKEIVEEDGLC